MLNVQRITGKFCKIKKKKGKLADFESGFGWSVFLR
jgi:hypothetical protein